MYYHTDDSVKQNRTVSLSGFGPSFQKADNKTGTSAVLMGVTSILQDPGNHEMNKQSQIIASVMKEMGHEYRVQKKKPT